MHVVVTGATGQVGTALRSLLGADPAVRVTGVVRNPPGDVAPTDATRWVSCDLSEPMSVAVLAPLLADADALVHLARDASGDAGLAALTNIGGTAHVAAAAGQARVPRLLYVSRTTGATSSTAAGLGTGRESRPVGGWWAVTGIPTSWRGEHREAQARLFDELGARVPRVAVTRVRPPTRSGSATHHRRAARVAEQTADSLARALRRRALAAA